MEILHNTAENSANIRPYNSWIFFVLFQNFLFLNSATLRLEKFIGFSMRRTQTGCRLSRTTNWKDFNFSNVRHIGFDSCMPSRKRVTRTHLKRHNFGIFWLVIFARRQPCFIFRTKICSKFYPFQVKEFWENGFLVAQGKNAGNPLWITEYFNTAKAEIRLSKSEFGLFSFG